MAKKTLRIVFAALCVVIGCYPGLYFILDQKFGLLSTKSDALLADIFWNTGFYMHIVPGGLALLIGWIQFSPKIRNRNLALHRRIGQAYVMLALISSLAGVYIGFFATGGVIASAGFICLGLIWFYTTLTAYLHIRKKQINRHEQMMTYSYAACFAAVTLRLWLPFLTACTGDFVTSYRIVAWLCWVPNLVVARIITNRRVIQSSTTSLLILLISGSTGCGHARQSNLQEPLDPVPVLPAVIYLSADSGQTWQPFANGIPKEATASGFISMGNKIFASTGDHGVFMTAGENDWGSVGPFFTEGLDINAIEAIDRTIVIGTSRHGIFTTEDEGKNWKHEPGELDHIPVRCLFVAGENLLAGTDRGIYQSVDRGANWSHLYGNVQVNGFTQSGNDIYAAAVDGALLTNDLGAHWHYIYRPYTLHDISTDGSHVYAMTLGDGLLKTDNGGITWEHVNDGLGASGFYTFEVKNLGNDLFAAQWDGIYRSADAGKNWALLKGGLPDSTAFMTLAITQSGIVAGIGLRK